MHKTGQTISSCFGIYSYVDIYKNDHGFFCDKMGSSGSIVGIYNGNVDFFVQYGNFVCDLLLESM